MSYPSLYFHYLTVETSTLSIFNWIRWLPITIYQYTFIIPKHLSIWAISKLAFVLGNTQV